MKKIFIYAALAAGLALGACSAEDVIDLNPNAIPQASEIDAVIDVDQTTNEVTFTLNNKGYVPVWKIHKSETNEVISTVNGYHDIFTIAGTYTVEVKMYNANGVCDGVKDYTFTVDNTIVDFAKYMTPLTGGESKTWAIDGNVAGHLGCGEPGTDGLNWWSAAPMDKKDWGVYDNRMTFTKGTEDAGTYVYDPGTSGTIYVNTGISGTPYEVYKTDDGLDFRAPAERQETTFSFKVEGTDLFLVFPAGTLLGYLPNAEAYNNPKFKVHSISGSKVELSIDNGGIAWHYILGKPGEPAFNGFKYDSEFNLWKKATLGDPGFWYAPGWNQIADPVVTKTTNSFSFNLPEATTDQWQGQFFIPTDIAVNSGTNYDFSCIISVSKDHPGVTVKFTDATDDGNFFFADRVAIKAGEDYVFYKSDMPGIDAAEMKMFFDFGGNQADTEVTISNIVFKDHANDDGTVLPVIPDEPEQPVEWMAEDSADNLWWNCSYDMTFWYAPGWAQIADPGFETKDHVYTISLPAATSDQWQAQVAFHTDITTSAEKAYDFRITLSSNTDHPGVTIKLVKEGDDNVFYTADRHALTAYEDATFSFINMAGIDMEKVTLFLDFGGCAENTEVQVSHIILQEHHE